MKNKKKQIDKLCDELGLILKRLEKLNQSGDDVSFELGCGLVIAKGIKNDLRSIFE